MKGGEKTMQSFADYQLRALREQREREYRQADLVRRVRVSRSASSYSVRQTVGRSFVRLGERLAGESSLELARSR
jgi:hypothetical protein